MAEHADAEKEMLRRRVAELEGELALSGRRQRGVRKRSRARIFGIPLWEIAMGPDPASGETRGHARAIFAMGDIATGIFAMGGVARGILAFGGVAIGLVTFGGCSIGFGLAIGGLAVGGIAVGGCAAGVIAVGGAAFGYYAMGGGGLGVYFLGPARNDPEAVELFQRWFEGFGAGRR